MSRNENDDIKKLYIADFSVWDCDDEIYRIDEIINNAISSSEGVYIYRHHAHLLKENTFIKWLKNEAGLICYKEVALEFTEDNIIQSFVPRNNESVYYIGFNKDNKMNFIKHFKLSIRDIKNRIGKIKTNKYLEKELYIDDPTYDQYDFLFTVGDQVILFTDTHDFSFVVAEEEYEKSE